MAAVIRLVFAVGAALLLGQLAAAAAPSGEALPGLEPFDAEMTALMQRWDLPGGNLAVAVKGRIVLARGYGVADRATGAPAQPTTLFRLGSLSKPITAVAVLRLVEGGKLALDDAVIPRLGELGPRPQAITDPRVHRITIRQLLQHTGGFDRDVSGDPMFQPRAAQAAARQGAALPPGCVTILRDALEGRLDFDPGSRHAYSNLGYCMLGRIVERASGLTYEDYVRRRVLVPAGAGGLRLAKTLVAAEGEASYYDYPGAPLVAPMPGLVAPRLVAAPYGAFEMEALDSYGGWIGSALDFLRFLLAIDGARGPALLAPPSLAEMFARPPGLEAKPTYYGLGFLVRPLRDGRNWWHAGSQAGMKSFAVRTAQGHAWVAAFNTRPKDRAGFARDLDETLWRAAKAVTTWPDGELFPVPR